MTEDVSRLHIAERHIGDVTLLMLSGELLLDDGDLVLRACVQDLIAKSRLKIVADFGGITHVDSAGMGMMVAELQKVRAGGGDLKLLHLTGRVKRLLATMKVLTIFQVFEDETAAVRSFSRR